MLGHLLPVLLTSLMHPNLQTLTMADALMPQLVQLVLYTSQVGSPYSTDQLSVHCRGGAGNYKHSQSFTRTKKTFKPKIQSGMFRD